MSVVEQYARAHIVTDVLEDDRGAVPVVLRYDPEADPRCVHMALPGAAPREWAVARELLEQGLLAPAGRGEIRVWPCGRVQAVIEFHTAQGVSVVQLETKTLARFLRRTYAATAEPVPH
ncbi:MULTISPECIES: SsgA family sporulation/cell division regulator [unclassified Streptomyces]|uniref:SsgA family sporulation/cell division regulator n=1 Tax=unclassified Streptomyces TaxID=2593676 RepID=UPI000B2F0B1E|nr:MULTISPECIES: SsgA family sporulation/cell division regulator [unclassified Streptomyces]AZM61774.1 SsgA family sporulation/cell division regulator [Streptomyces sp. WAC 01438]RSN02227.1 SsgA family sporulation/cell division regulator [Streptomyces sp. WAC 01420]